MFNYVFFISKWENETNGITSILTNQKHSMKYQNIFCILANEKVYKIIANVWV